MRLYAAAMVLASGGYAVAIGSTETTTGAALLWLLGAVVLLHGAVLLADWAERPGTARGPLMVAYVGLKQANQAWLATAPPAGRRAAG